MEGLITKDWLLRDLVCPRDRETLRVSSDGLRCARGHHYSVIGDVPVLLTSDLDATHPYRDASLERISADGAASTTFEREGAAHDGVDAYVQDEIVRTNGNLYRHLRGRLPRYPIPILRLPDGNGRSLLDVGCNWGRWTFAAARAGYRAVGIDPWIEGALAGARIARQLGASVAFVVGDARQLPFRDGAFDTSFSYSVLQHFDKAEARSALAEMSRVTAIDGTLLAQMPNVFGLRQAYNSIRQRLAHDSNPFRVRYWRPSELKTTFEGIVGPSSLSVDGFLSLNVQASDVDLLPWRYASVVRVSEALRAASRVLPALRAVADSLYVRSRNVRAYRARPMQT